jgi:hypothetical protein
MTSFGHSVRYIDKLIIILARDGNESNVSWLIAKLLKIMGHFGFDLIDVSFCESWLYIHLIDGDNHLVNTECVSKQNMFMCLTAF